MFPTQRSARGPMPFLLESHLTPEIWTGAIRTTEMRCGPTVAHRAGHSCSRSLRGSKQKIYWDYEPFFPRATNRQQVPYCPWKPRIRLGFCRKSMKS